MDRVVTYIPNLHREVEELTLRKQKLVEAIENKKRSRELEPQASHIRAISVLGLEGSGDEAVVQICMKREKEDEFSNLLHVMEVQGLSILSASTSQVSRDQMVFCYNFHVKVDFLFIYTSFLFDFMIFIESSQCASKLTHKSWVSKF